MLGHGMSTRTRTRHQCDTMVRVVATSDTRTSTSTVRGYSFKWACLRIAVPKHMQRPGARGSMEYGLWTAGDAL
eukprot:scaffold246131_cov44-Prasinocladus_malaysianus.AAC.1